MKLLQRRRSRASFSNREQIRLSALGLFFISLLALSCSAMKSSRPPRLYRLAHSRNWLADAAVDHEIKISNGMLTSVANRPSPVVGFVEAPLRITEQLVKLLTELLQLRNDGPTQQAELGKKLLDAELALEESRRALEEARG